MGRRTKARKSGDLPIVVFDAFGEKAMDNALSDCGGVSPSFSPI